MLPALSIVLCPLCLVAQNFMCSLNLLKLDDELGLASWIAIGVILQSQSPERFADLAFAGVSGDFEVSVVVPSRVGFDHRGG